MIIRPLDELTINRIAAGEVVDRPASAVKELVENALDAGSRRIRVRLEGGGLDLLSVDDDGCGMDAADLHICWQPHTTSKLTRLEDLMSVGTYGFRGEALSSLAAVAELRIDSHQQDEEEGHAVLIRDGKLLREEPSGRPRGTCIEVRGLFAGVPVRRKFLSAPAAEAQRVLNTLVHEALARPDVEFRLVHGGRELLSAPAEDRRARVRRLLGKLADNLCDVLWEADGISVAGFVGGPGSDRGRADQVHVSINRRPIQGGMPARAIARGLNLPVGRHPVAVLDIAMPLDTVDVNVHPQKKEVRFQAEAPVFHAIADAVAHALDLATPLPLYAPSENASDGNAIELASEPAATIAFPDLLSSPTSEETVQEDLFASSQHLLVFPGMTPAEATPQPIFRDVTFLGTSGYLLCQIQGGLMVIDQRAAHERILFDQAMGGLTRGSQPPSQQLLFPHTLELPVREHETAIANLDRLRELSFDLEPFGGASLLLRGVPSAVNGDHAEAILTEILGHLADTDTTQEAFDLSFARAYAQAAAISRDQVLPETERARLVDELFASSDPWTSPDGHTVVARLTGSDLARFFR